MTIALSPAYPTSVRETTVRTLRPDRSSALPPLRQNVQRSTRQSCTPSSTTAAPRCTDQSPPDMEPSYACMYVAAVAPTVTFTSAKFRTSSRPEELHDAPSPGGAAAAEPTADPSTLRTLGSVAATTCASFRGSSLELLLHGTRNRVAFAAPGPRLQNHSPGASSSAWMFSTNRPRPLAQPLASWKPPRPKPSVRPSEPAACSASPNDHPPHMAPCNAEATPPVTLSHLRGVHPGAGLCTVTLAGGEEDQKHCSPLPSNLASAPPRPML
mmetsp:Transcript_16264/g.61664  ORF Transcript_16264/g.61664 Transcript_16264/m.61664 type:complete len:269 (-) Transcript_16264:897-1703(-)